MITKDLIERLLCIIPEEYHIESYPDDEIRAFKLGIIKDVCLPVMDLLLTQILKSTNNNAQFLEDAKAEFENIF